jgi:hypothetical protein
MSESPESASSGTATELDLKQHLEQLDEMRLADMPDSEMVATIHQRRYMADLRLRDSWKTKTRTFKRKLKFQRGR